MMKNMNLKWPPGYTIAERLQHLSMWLTKGTKLETIFDRINLINMRFEILKRDIVIIRIKIEIKSSG